MFMETKRAFEPKFPNFMVKYNQPNFNTIQVFINYSQKLYQQNHNIAI